MKDLNIKYKNQIIDIILKNISSELIVEIFLFGSFAQNKARMSSDVDVCLKSEKKIDYKILSKIKSDLHDSNIPYKVDLVDFHNLDQSFKDVAFKEVIKWYPTK